MALDDPLQWVVIAVVAIVFLMWGPKKIPELARSIGLARKEFNNASAGLNQTPSAAGVAARTVAPPAATVRPQVAISGDPLIDTAKKLGIKTEGKSRDEISNSIVELSKR